MKKFIIFVFIIIATSCSVVRETYVTIGDITRKDYNGVVIDSWEGATIESETYMTDAYYGTIKANQGNFNGNNGVLNFFDANGEYHYIQGGIISIDNIKTIKYVDGKRVASDNTKDAEKMALIQDYKNVLKKIEYHRNQLKHFRKNSIEYKRLKKKIEELTNEKNDIVTNLRVNYGLDFMSLNAYMNK